MSEKVVTRFAPSPTGFQHVGGIRTALFAYLWAKHNKGTFILRIEDTDKAREVQGSITHLQDSLRWLGLMWDYGPDKPGPFGSCLQSERLDVYKHYAQKLIDKGLAYADPYAPEEIETFRQAALSAKRPYLYRDHRPKNPPTWDGSTPLRLKVPEIKRYRWEDAVRGPLEGGEEMLDDVVLIKSDGYPTYNFAHIVDDAEMGVTHIFRSDEFIASTPRFLSIYDALEINPPVFVTLPPIMGPDGKKKLSKRDGAKDVLDYAKDGYLPSSLTNFLALIGWNPGGEKEIFSLTELIDIFSIKKIQRSGGAFNIEKLLWMNKKHLAQMDKTSFFDYVKNALPSTLLESPNYSDERLEKLLPSMRERVSVAKEITEAAEKGEYDWVFMTPRVEPHLLQWKNDTDPQAWRARLTTLTPLLKDADFTSPDTIKDAIWPYAEEVGKGEVLWPLRVALTGQERSLDPFTCAYILGKEEAVKRITDLV